MDQALHLSAVLCLHGQAVPIAAHGDDRILEIGAQRSVYKACQCRVYLVVDPIYVPADSLQRRAGVVADLILGDDASFNLVRERCERLQAVKKYVEAVGHLCLCVMAPVGFYTRSVGEEPADAQQLGNAQGAADLEPFHRFFYRSRVAEGDTSLLYDPGKSGGCLILKCIDLFKVCHGL